MKILVTGCSGFISREFVSYFKNINHAIYLTNRNNLNVLNEQEVDNFFKDNKIDVVVHSAAKGGRRTCKESYEDFLCNMRMYDNLSKHADEFKMMFHFGSGAEFDRRTDIDDVKEEEIYDSFPVDFYGFSKKMIAKKIKKHSDNIINLRLFGCFGIQENEDRMIKSNIKRYVNNEPIIIHKNKKMDFFFAEDLCRVIEFYLQNWNPGTPRDVNMVYPQKETLKDIANMINFLSENKSKIIVEQDGLDNSYCGNGEKLNNLNIDLVGLSYGLRKLYSSLFNKKRF